MCYLDAFLWFSDSYEILSRLWQICMFMWFLKEVWCVSLLSGYVLIFFLLVNILEKTIRHHPSHLTCVILTHFFDFPTPMRFWVAYDKYACLCDFWKRFDAIVFWVAMFLSFSIGKYIRKDHQTSPISPDMCYLDPFLWFSDSYVILSRLWQICMFMWFLKEVWCVVFWVAMFLSFSIGKYIRKDHQTSPISPDMCYLDPFLWFSDSYEILSRLWQICMFMGEFLKEVWCVVFWVAMFLSFSIGKYIRKDHQTSPISPDMCYLDAFLWFSDSYEILSRLWQICMFMWFLKAVWCVVFWVAMFLSFSIGKYIRKDYQTSPISPDMCYLDAFLWIFRLLWDFESPMTNMHVYVIFERGLMRSLLSGYVLIFFYW